MKLRPPKCKGLDPVAVYWIDAAGSREHLVVPEPCVTFGVISEITDDYIRIAAEISRVDHTEQWSPRDFTVIPAGMVLAVKKLIKIREPHEVYELVRARKVKRGRAKGRGSATTRSRRAKDTT